MDSCNNTDHGGKPNEPNGNEPKGPFGGNVGKTKNLMIITFKFDHTLFPALPSKTNWSLVVSYNFDLPILISF